MSTLMAVSTDLSQQVSVCMPGLHRGERSGVVVEVVRRLPNLIRLAATGGAAGSLSWISANQPARGSPGLRLEILFLTLVCLHAGRPRSSKVVTSSWSGLPA